MKKDTKKTAAKKKAEMSLEELAEVVGGAKNIDNPIVQTAIGAFNKRLKGLPEIEPVALRASSRPTGARAL